MNIDLWRSTTPILPAAASLPQKKNPDIAELTKEARPDVFTERLFLF